MSKNSENMWDNVTTDAIRQLLEMQPECCSKDQRAYSVALLQPFVRVGGLSRPALQALRLPCGQSMYRTVSLGSPGPFVEEPRKTGPQESETQRLIQDQWILKTRPLRRTNAAGETLRAASPE